MHPKSVFSVYAGSSYDSSFNEKPLKHLQSRTGQGPLETSSSGPSHLTIELIDGQAKHRPALPGQRRRNHNYCGCRTLAVSTRTPGPMVELTATRCT